MKKRLVMMSTAVLMAGVLASCGAKAEKKAESSTAKETSKAAEESGKETENASAGGTLSIVATSEDYKKLFDEFTKDTGIQTELLSKSSGDVLNQLKAGGGTPIADLWFGGGIDAFRMGFSKKLIWTALPTLRADMLIRITTGILKALL